MELNKVEMREHLVQLVTMSMPFGKYKGVKICDLPESYLVWFSNKGFPQGKLGVLLASIYEIKLNGVEHVLTPIKNNLRSKGR